MLKIYFTAILLLISVLPAFSQKEQVLAVLDKYGLYLSMLEAGLKEEGAEYYFKCSTTIESKSKVMKYTFEFDPRRSAGAFWVGSNGGEETTDKETRQLETYLNEKVAEATADIDENSLQLEADTEEELVISFKYSTTTLPSSYAFFADCLVKAHINKAEKAFTFISFESFRPTVLMGKKVEKLKGYGTLCTLHGSQGCFFDQLFINAASTWLGKDFRLLSRYYDYGKTL
ncbi:hypothetical protein V6R21_12920 [Limibacter armeniacum]|uniref:hypothetical protein n=1 Tax=Limibacter armeniacum TaxID=466084 RepID=UPI002FE55891